MRTSDPEEELLCFSGTSAIEGAGVLVEPNRRPQEIVDMEVPSSQQRERLVEAAIVHGLHPELSAHRERYINGHAGGRATLEDQQPTGSQTPHQALEDSFIVPGQ